MCENRISLRVSDLRRCVFLSKNLALVWTAEISINCEPWYVYILISLSRPPAADYIWFSVHTWHWNLCCDCYNVVTIMLLVTAPSCVKCNIQTAGLNVIMLNLLIFVSNFPTLVPTICPVYTWAPPPGYNFLFPFVPLLEECSRVVVFLPFPRPLRSSVYWKLHNLFSRVGMNFEWWTQTFPFCSEVLKCIEF